MKKKMLLLMPFILFPFLNGCSNNDDYIYVSKNQMIDITNDDHDVNKWTINSSSEEIINKIENKNEFVVYLGREDCSSCSSFIDNCLIPYLKESRLTIYYLNNSLIPLDALNKAYPELFNYELSLPSVMLFKNAKLFHLVDRSRYERYDSFKPVMKRKIKTTSILYLSSLERLEEIKSQFMRYVLTFNNHQNNVTSLFYQEHIFLFSKSSLINEIHFDVSKLNNEEKALLEGLYPKTQFHYENIEELLIYYNGEIVSKNINNDFAELINENLIEAWFN